MGVEIRFTKAGEVFARANYAGGAKAGEKFACIGDDFPGIARDCTRTHHLLGSWESEIYDRSEIGVEAESAAGFADDFAVPAK